MTLTGLAPAGSGSRLAGDVWPHGDKASATPPSPKMLHRKGWGGRECQGLSPASLRLCLRTAKGVTNFFQGG